VSALWSRCDCGSAGWRYLTADGRSGWRCWCGAHRPDRPEFQLELELEEVQLPLFELEVS